MDASKTDGQLDFLSPLQAAQQARRRRKILAWLLFLTVTPALILHLLATYRQSTKPAPPASPLLPLLRPTSDHWAIWLTDLDGSFHWQYQAQQPMPAASLIKLPVAVWLERQIQAGKISGQKLVTLHQADKQPGNGGLREAPAGRRYSLETLLRLSLQQSDNTAFHLLCNQLDRQKLDNDIYALGLKNTSFSQDQTTAADIGYLWAKLMPDKFIGWLENTPFNDYSPAKLGNIKVAHKIGREGKMVADSGIIFLPHHRLVFVFIGRNLNPEEGIKVIQNLASASAILELGTRN